MTSTAYKRRKRDELPLLGEHDRREYAPGKAKATQRYTQYEAVRLLLAHPLTGPLFRKVRHWADPCAGDGRMRSWVAKAYLDHRLLGHPPKSWTLADIMHCSRLSSMASSTANVKVYNPADLFADLPEDERVECVLTNWPWYGWDRHFMRVRELYPKAIIAGISCDQERRDGDRAKWWREHTWDWIAQLPGRQTFPAPNERGPSTYPYTTSWYIALPGTRPNFTKLVHL
jgi:hypothetical protein